MDKSHYIIQLYEEKDYDSLVNIYDQVKNRIQIDNIFWIVSKNKNKKFINQLFEKNKNKFTIKQLGLLKNIKNINMKSVFDQAQRRLK